MDTPGFGSLYVNDFEKEDLKYYFREFEPYEGNCKFQGCSHIHEPGCGVKDALETGKIRRADMKTIWNCTVNWNRNSDIEEEKYELYFGAVSSGGGFSMSCRTDEADRGKRGKVSAF